jgi:hypothetical protein
LTGILGVKAMRSPGRLGALMTINSLDVDLGIEAPHLQAHRTNPSAIAKVP